MKKLLLLLLSPLAHAELNDPLVFYDEQHNQIICNEQPTDDWACFMYPVGSDQRKLIVVHWNQDHTKARIEEL